MDRKTYADDLRGHFPDIRTSIEQLWGLTEDWEAAKSALKDTSEIVKAWDNQLGTLLSRLSRVRLLGTLPANTKCPICNEQ